jgi:hypothetical protein
VITMKDFMEVADYHVTECSKYYWDCFGPNAHTMDHWDGSHTGKSFHVVFDTKDNTVFQMEAYNFATDKAYRWSNPDYTAEHKAEAISRNVDADQAYDDVKFVDMDKEQFLAVAFAIAHGE